MPADRADALAEQLYREYAGPLQRFVARLVGGDQQLAEDVVQETLTRAWRRAGELTGAGVTSLRPWLMTVARRIVIDQHRSRQARPREVGDAVLEHHPAQGSTEDVIRSMEVTEALRALSPAHREVIVEVYYRGASIAEAAEKLGTPPGTVKSRAYYALRALRLALEERGVTA